jgi:hypothetical protein
VSLAEGSGRSRAVLSPLMIAKENHHMTERQQENWAGLLLTALVAGLILGAWLLLRLTTT